MTEKDYANELSRKNRELEELQHRYDSLNKRHEEMKLRLAGEIHKRIDAERALRTCPGKTYSIKRVIFSNPATIVYWDDGSKTVVYCNDNMKDGKPQAAETFSKEVGLAMAIAKKACGNTSAYNNVFRDFIPGMKEAEKARKKAEKAKRKAKEQTNDD